MGPGIKVAAALALLLVFVGALYYAGSLYGKDLTTGNATGSTAPLDETFDRSDFLYGPQAWVPYASHLPVVPGGDAEGNNTFMLMLVDLRASAGRNDSSGPTQVEYDLKGLEGMAAFHVYGYNKASNYGSGISWTNRVEGTGSNGYYVSAGPGQPLVAGNTSPIDNHAFIRVSNRDGPAYDDSGNGTYFLNFNKPGGGLNSLRISTDPATGGQTYYTDRQAGKFYVTYDSGNGFDDVLLLVAVNGTMSDEFGLHLKSGAYGP